MRYALIENNLVVNIIELANLSDWHTPTDILIQSDIADIGDSYDGASITPKLVPILPKTWNQFQAQAQSLLDKSDLVAIRCLKAGIAFPVVWQTYVVELRAIVSATSGDATVALPVQPAFPTGA